MKEKRESNWFDGIIKNIFKNKLRTYKDENGDFRILVDSDEELRSLVLLLHANQDIVNYYQDSTKRILSTNAYIWHRMFEIIKSEIKDEFGNYSVNVHVDYVSNTIVVKNS